MADGERNVDEQVFEYLNRKGLLYKEALPRVRRVMQRLGEFGMPCSLAHVLRDLGIVKPEDLKEAVLSISTEAAPPEVEAGGAEAAPEAPAGASDVEKAPAKLPEEPPRLEPDEEDEAEAAAPGPAKPDATVGAKTLLDLEELTGGGGARAEVEVEAEPHHEANTDLQREAPPEAAAVEIDP